MASVSLNETIDDRTLHEIYLLPFEMAVREGNVAAVMCSYNTVNEAQMCENKHILTDVLRLAHDASARRVVAFHHDPARDDRALDALGAHAEHWLRERKSRTTAVVAQEGWRTEL